jgi:uncharacterized protein (TIGR04141 family)
LTSLRRWLAFEAVIDNTHYCFVDGDWIKIGGIFADQVHDRVAELLTHRSTLQFPTWCRPAKSDSEDEHRFCKHVVDTRLGFLCLDKNLARTPFHPKLELCDLVGPDDEPAHVKWLGRATSTSHLYAQADVSATALRNEPETLAQLTHKVHQLDPQRTQVCPSTVVLAIAGRGWSMDSLFAFSMVGWLRLNRSLRAARMDLQFADILFEKNTDTVSGALAA